MDDNELDYEQMEPRSDYEDEVDDVTGGDDSVLSFQRTLEDEKFEQQEKMATEKAFGLSGAVGKHLKVTAAEGAALRKELGVVHNQYELRAVFVNGVDGMHDYQIQKVFAAFRATDVFKIDDSNAIVQFVLRQDVAAMMLNMTKVLKRVRGKKKADEDGEVMSDDEDEAEEGQIMQEKGDDVELVEGLVANENGIVEDSKNGDQVTVDVSVKSIPDGKWRVVTQHVGSDKFLIVRYPTVEEYSKVKNLENVTEVPTRKRVQVDTEFWSHEPKNRGGLNLFDKEGNELDWDYQHDTRFYGEGDTTGDSEKGKETDQEAEELETTKKVEEDKFELPKGIKVRGRGAVKCGFLFGDKSSSLASDDQKQTKRKKVEDNDEKNLYQKDDVLSRVKPGRSLEGRVTFNR